MIICLVIILSGAYAAGSVLLAPSHETTDPIALTRTFNDLILSAAAIFFAFSFADARYWPTIGEAAAASYIYIWGLAVVATMLLDWTTSYLDIQFLSTVSLVSWFVCSALAVLSIFRILRLGDPERINKYLAGNLAKYLNRSRSDNSKNRFMRATRESVVTGSDLSVRDLTDQLSYALRSVNPSDKTINFAAEFVSEVSWGALGGSISGSTASRSILKVLDPEVIFHKYLVSSDHQEMASRRITESIQVIVPLLTRTDSQSKALTNKETRHEFKAMSDASLQMLNKYVSLFDPSPRGATTLLDTYVELLSPSEALRCLNAFSIRPKKETIPSIYATYQHITGIRFDGDYWNGAPILSDLVSQGQNEMPSIRTDLLGIYATSILSSTLPPGTSVARDGDAPEEFIAVAAWLRVIMSLGSFDNDDHAFSEWLEATLAYKPMESNLGEPAYDVYQVSVSLAVICLFRLRPWEDAKATARGKMFLERFNPEIASDINVLFKTITGVAPTAYTHKDTITLKDELLA